MQKLQLEAKYAVFDSVEDMLAPESMSKILQRHVSVVTCQLFEAHGGSNSHFYNVTADDQRLVMKRTHMSSDWLALGSMDSRYRTVRLWQYGVLERIQPRMDHAIVAAGCDGDDCVLLMHDVSSSMTKMGQELTLKAAHSMLDALAAIHATFWEDEELSNPELGLSNVETFVTAFWPVDFNRNRYDTTRIEKAWDELFDMVEPDVRSTIQAIVANPKALIERLADHPSTLVHGDFKPGNIAILPKTKQVVAIDWQLAGHAPAVIDLHWFLTSYDTAAPFDGAEYYRQQLATQLGNRFDPNLWQSMLEVGYLAGVLRLGWIQARCGVEQGRECWQKSAASFNDIVRKGVKWL